jgi:sulfite reductase (NADPH) hemoprotein beta-component
MFLILSFVSFTGAANSQTIVRLVMRIAQLSTLPIAFHFAINNYDLADVLLLRSAVPFFLLSTTAQQAQDHALLASKLAREQRKAVIHAFYASPEDLKVEEIADTDVQSYLSAAPVNGYANGHSEDPSGALFHAYEVASSALSNITGRLIHPFLTSDAAEPHTVILVAGKADIPVTVEGISVVPVFLLNPTSTAKILSLVPSTTKNVIVLEQISKWPMKWTPLYLDVVNALQQREEPVNVRSGYLGFITDVTEVDLLKLVEAPAPLSLGQAFPLVSASSIPHIPKHETSYTKILSHLFGDRLQIANAPSKENLSTSPEFALGKVQGQLDSRKRLEEIVEDALQSPSIDSELHTLLSKWLLGKNDAVKSAALAIDIIRVLSSSSLPQSLAILNLKDHLPATSRWIIGSDAWSYDLGSSGLHHTIASGLNVNVLLLDTVPYSTRTASDAHRRKHDVGLYAMNHGDVYVASIAVYSSYAQVLQALVEAEKFNGPSVVLAYLPYQNDDTTALDVLKETKLAVDAGYWPLYRWDPSKEKNGKEPFSLDSDAVKNDLKQFLDRQNHLSQLVRSKPQMAAELVGSLGETVKEARRNKAKQSYNELLTALDAPPLLILYASDGGAAEKKAKRLLNRAKARGLAATLSIIDSVPIASIAEEEYVVFITSTAGQGEPPQNGRQFFKSINSLTAQGETVLSKTKYTVFGMGDSHYWPRPEDAHYYNKPGKDLDAKLSKLGAERFVDLGLGDDQDADGTETGYKIWEPLLWKALKVDSIEITEAEPEAITNEHIKAASGYLRGTISEGLQDPSTGALAPSDGQLTKFHGIYQQDDRDIREEREVQGVEPAYSFMIRVRMPGGVCTPAQWLQMDQIADEHGCGTFKITTRATFQFHGVIKRHLKPAIQDINRVLLDTLAACGDVNR